MTLHSSELTERCENGHSQHADWMICAGVALEYAYNISTAQHSMPEIGIPQPELRDTGPGTSISAQEPWTLAERVAFRFAFVYLILYCWPASGRVSLLEAIPVGAERLTNLAEAPWHALYPWVAVHIFHLTGPVTQYHPTGSGDTTLDYVQVFCFAVIAVLAAALWSILDRRRTQYRLLYAWLRLVVRFTLAFTLLSYGFAKVYPLQFFPPFLSTLTEAFGEASPMGLLWTFMGASAAYTTFCGLAEASAGLLLLFRRTTTLGALFALAVMLNILMLNLCYDVPVKLYSAHLVLMSIFLLLPDAAALWSFFVLHRMSRPQGVWLPNFERRWLRRGAMVFQILVIASVLYGNIWGGYKMAKEYAGQLKHPSLYGVWDVDSFTRNGSPAPVPENIRWHRMIVNTAGYLVIRTEDGKALHFGTKYEEPKHNLKLNNVLTKQVGELTYSQPDHQHLVLRGKVDRDPVVIQFHRYDMKQLLLTSRGFHWINEDPFNR